MVIETWKPPCGTVLHHQLDHRISEHRPGIADGGLFDRVSESSAKCWLQSGKIEVDGSCILVAGGGDCFVFDVT